MYDNYEEYMKEILGYPKKNEQGNHGNGVNLQDAYPDIYKMLMPMVEKCCYQVNQPSESDIHKMALEIYFQFETDEPRPENRSQEKEQMPRRFDRNLERSITSKPMQKQETQKKEERIPKNPLLFDLIKILILNQVIGNNRPLKPMPPMPREYGYFDDPNYFHHPYKF